AQAVQQRLKSPVVAAQPLSGGDVNQAWRVTLKDARQVFLKHNSQAPPRMFTCEAAGLNWLREAHALVIPEVLAVSDPSSAGPHFLVLEFIASKTKVNRFDELLGQGLATLHRSSVQAFGWSASNFIATLVQDNSPSTLWSTFYRERRLRPQVRAAIDKGVAPRAWNANFERLFSRLDSIAGPCEPPARLHGDLWAGNLLVSAEGKPCLIDPAVYAGHREIDLAMMRLFGGFAPEVFDAYAESYPLATGWSERIALYQLYPLLVHVNLFGKGYVSAVERALNNYL
ncbi:MAG: fructosamine kinase family protein, partial [Planctomycetales bacterium]|nr:fructosamine kinase family protein [Planctomycetales bacterium]